MAYFKATIEVLMDVGCKAEACDCIAETMREHLRQYTPESSIIDWRYADDGGPVPHMLNTLDPMTEVPA